MAPPPAAAGSTAASIPQRTLNKANQREPQDYLGTAGDSPGRTTVASSTTALRPAPMASRGASARSWSGGTKKSGSGPDSTLPTSTKNKPPDYRPKRGAKGMDAIARRQAVHHAPRRRGLALGHQRPERWSAAHALRAAGIAFGNPLYPESRHESGGGQQGASRQPLRRSWPTTRFPYVLTTYRLTEHHTAGGMSRTLSHLAELQPELFCEVSPELAAEASLEHGDLRHHHHAARNREARALVTRRMRPLWVEGRTVHQVGLPYHWGYQGPRHRRRRQRPAGHFRRAERAHHGNQGAGLRYRAGRRAQWAGGAGAIASANGAVA